MAFYWTLSKRDEINTSFFYLVFIALWLTNVWVDKISTDFLFHSDRIRGNSNKFYFKKILNFQLKVFKNTFHRNLSYFEL
jgi:hypothetical protein